MTAIAQLERLSSIKERSAGENALAEILVTLIEAYEARYVRKPVSPLDTLLELVAAHNLKSKDIAELIGSKGNASDVLHGKRKISRAIAAKFAARFNVPHTLFL